MIANFLKKPLIALGALALGLGAVAAAPAAQAQSVPVVGDYSSHGDPTHPNRFGASFRIDLSGPQETLHVTGPGAHFSLAIETSGNGYRVLRFNGCKGGWSHFPSSSPHQTIAGSRFRAAPQPYQTSRCHHDVVLPSAQGASGSLEMPFYVHEGGYSGVKRAQRYIAGIHYQLDLPHPNGHTVHNSIDIQSMSVTRH